MKLILFTIYNCKGCNKHLREVILFSNEIKIPLRVVDVDDPINFHMALAAMRKYKLGSTPSLILIDSESKELLAMSDGIDDLENFKANKIFTL